MPATQKPVLIYIIAPYRAKTEWDLLQNIRAAEEIAAQVWKAGGVAVCSHKNTAHFGGIVPDEVFLAGTLEMMRRCDAVLCLASWVNSSGGKEEVAEALRLQIPIGHHDGRLVNDYLLSDWIAKLKFTLKVRGEASCE